MQCRDVLMQVLRFELNGTAVSAPLLTYLRGREAEPLVEWTLQTARRHDLSHLVADAFLRLDVPIPTSSAQSARHDRYLAEARVATIDREYDRITRLFDENSLDYLPLKGCVLRALYPARWMRTSCDLDLLVRRREHRRAVALLVGAFSCRVGHRDLHDVTLHFPSGLRLELHFSLVEDGSAHRARRVLKDPFSLAHPVADAPHRYALSDEALYLYHIAHMAKHFAMGGCGIRSLMDLWLLSHLAEANTDARAELLARAGLESFADRVRRVCDGCFDPLGAATDETDARMLRFIVDGGAFGSTRNRAALDVGRGGGGASYAIRRAFPPYAVMVRRFPVLRRCPLLLPMLWLYRWLSLPFRKGGLSRALDELRTADLAAEGESQSADLLTEIGL